MPATALLAAVAGQTLAELSPVPECGGAGFGLGREPAFARARFASTRLAGLLVGEPAFDVPLTHDPCLRLTSGEPERTSLRISADRPASPWMDHLATELLHVPQCRLDIVHLKVRH